MTIVTDSPVMLGRARLAPDLETWPIGPGAVYPKPVCITMALRDEKGALGSPWLVANGDLEWEKTVEGLFDWLDEDVTREMVWHNGHGFDLPDIAIWFPRLISRIFAVLDREQVRDTITREKLLNLAMHGVVDHYFTPDGQQRDISYRLASLVARHLGLDRTAVKGVDKDGNQVRTDVWRLNFNSLDGKPSREYPVEASNYALEDALDALRVSIEQDLLAHREFVANGAVGHDGGPFDVFKTEPLHVGAMFCLSLATYEGFGVDEAVVSDMESSVAKALRPEQTELLFESGLFSRPQPARPYKNGALNEDGTPKMKSAEPAHKSNKKLLELVVKTWAANHLCDEDGCKDRGRECDRHGLPPLKRTEPSKTHKDGQISCDGEVISDLAPFDPVLAQYEHWQTLQKLVTLEIPRLREALRHGGTIHPAFDEFKKTGRTSSRRSKMFPSVNIQQIPRGVEVEERGSDGKPILDVKGKPKVIRIEPRHAYVPRRPGWVLVSIDYSFIELVTLAQQTKRVIGYSVLLDKINKGFDPHAFLGAQLAHGLDADFAEYCRSQSAQEPDDIYRLFRSLKGASDEEKRFYKTWRTFSKPVGLGFPGGLGPRTFVIYAKKLYGIIIKSIDQAKSFREVWAATFPENREYLNRYIRDELRDEQHTKEDRERFAYFSPLGAYRAKCSFTEAANGFALQTPSAEGMKLALWRVQRACWDETQKSCLYGCRTVAAIHDELLITMPDDQWLHERAMEASRLWIEGMNIICPDALVKAEPAAMRRWDKNAEPVYSRQDKKLRVWEPTVKYVTDEDGRLWVD